MIEIGKNRFVSANKVTGANIYQKENKWRIAFRIDTQVKEDQAQFSDAYETEEACRQMFDKMTGN
jgi:hypothetical protein